MSIYQELELTEKEYITLKKVGYTDSDIKGMFFGNATVTDVTHIKEAEYTGLLALVEGLQQKIEDGKKTSGTKSAVEDALRLRNRELQDEIKKLQETVTEEPKPKVIIEEKEKLVYVDKEVKPADYEELKKAGKALAQVVKKKEELEEKVKQQETIISERDKTIAKKEKVIEIQEEEKKKLKGTIESYEQKISGIQISSGNEELLKKEHKEMADALTEALRHVAKLEEESKKLQESNDDLKKELKIEQDDNEAGKERALKETERLNEQITKLKNRITALTENNSQEIEEQEHSDADYAALLREYEIYKSKHSHTDSDYDSLVTKAKTNNQVVSKADDFLGTQTKEDELRKLKQKYAVLEQNYERSQKELKKLKEEDIQITGKNRQKWVREGARLFAQGAGLGEGHQVYAYGMQCVENALNKWK